MTYLAIRRICDECFFCLWILADDVGGTGFNASSAADTAFNKFDSHDFAIFLTVNHCVQFGRLHVASLRERRPVAR